MATCWSPVNTVISEVLVCGLLNKIFAVFNSTVGAWTCESSVIKSTMKIFNVYGSSL